MSLLVQWDAFYWKTEYETALMPRSVFIGDGGPGTWFIHFIYFMSHTRTRKEFRGQEAQLW